MKLIRRSELTAQPWKNGGGLTWEIAAFPAGAGFEDMQWRISMAEVATEGGFSAFAGIDRTLTVLSGTGLHLDFAQGGSVALDNRTPPFSFPGEAALHARLSAGPVLDFNVMTRRGVCTHQVEMLAAGQPVPNCAVALVTRNQPVKIGDLVLHPDEIMVSDQNHDLSGQVASGPVIAVIVRKLT
ncbi:HutD family protein [Celeribacter halophilus]|jgi:environmental stress-induced protein Ves|uniref:HutD family protein n=1 Tax=Celeribacter halophilus TaxID=576117 RepID=A0AAW7XTT7_9RHOB|nr:HutD family protein [Celeribacter halophilus]MDO6456165.1 HutD family protein [Celeribacter halophilus]